MTSKQQLKTAISYTIAASWVIGSFELVRIAMHSKLPLTFIEGLKLSVFAWVWASALAAGMGLFFGGIAIWRPGFRSESDAIARGVAWASMGVLLVYLGPAALMRLGMGDPLVAGAMVFSIFGAGGVIWLNARFYLRRSVAGYKTPLRWWQACLVFAGLISTISSGSLAARGGGGAKGVPGDHNVLVITVDTLRRDHLSVYAALDGQEPVAQTPVMDGLADGGILFEDAVTPIPETAPSHGSMFTALHPIRHGLISNGHRLHGGFKTLAELLRDEGYATAAFVSSFAVDSRTGLDRGFHIYDDDYSPWLRGLSELQAFQVMSRLLMKFGNPERYAWLLERDGKRTNDRAADWLAEREDKPWFLWVHYFEPHAPYEGVDATVSHRDLLSKPEHVYSESEIKELQRLYALEVEEVDARIGELLAELDANGQTDNTLVVLTSDHGEQLGEHDIYFHHHGLYEESVRVPLLVKAPYLGVEGSVPQEVRLMDITPTVLGAVGNEPLKRSEGENLLGYVGAPSQPSMSCSLMGRQAPHQGGGALFGLRTQDVKYLVDVAADEEYLYNLKSDREELLNIAGEQWETVLQAREVVQRERDSMMDNAAAVGAGDVERLKAMGYMQ